jgi:DNA-entry nuclease
MEAAYSLEDQGTGLSFNIFCYNVQPQIEIDYATGDSKLVGEGDVPKTTEAPVTTIPDKSIEPEIPYRH